MKKEKRDRVMEVLGMIAEDAESDVMEYEGKPFTGVAVACFNGKQNAMIKTLAEVILEVVKDDIKESSD